MRLLLISLILWCQCAVAQFGTVQQPIFSMLSEGGWTPQSVGGLAYWWSAGDLADGNVTTWTDRVSSVVMTVTNGPATKDTNGVFFNGLLGFTNSTITLYSNYTRAWVAKLWNNAIGFGTFCRWGDDKGGVDHEPWSMYHSNNYVLQHFIAWDGGVPNQNDYPKVPWGYMNSLVMVSSNDVTYTYTNGVNSITGTDSRSSTISAIGAPSGLAMMGYVKELMIWTNALPWETHASNLWYWATNYYAGAYAPTAFFTNQTPSPSALRNNNNGYLGTVISSYRPITVTHLGRWIVSGNSNVHNLRLKAVVGGAVVATASLNTAGQSTNAFAYAECATPVVIPARAEYYLESEEATGGDYWNDGDFIAYVPSWSGTTTGSSIAGTGPFGDPGVAYVGVNFKYQEYEP